MDADGPAACVLGTAGHSIVNVGAVGEMPEPIFAGCPNNVNVGAAADVPAPPVATCQQ